MRRADRARRVRRALSLAGALAFGAASWLALAVAAYADAVVTWAGLLLGWREANPLVAAAIRAFGWDGLMGLKTGLVVVYGAVLGAGLLGTIRRGQWTAVLIAGVLASSVAAAGHLLVAWCNLRLLLGL